MPFSPFAWADRPSELDPLTDETPAEWLARIAAYASAHPGTLTPVDAAALADLETRLSGYTDTEVAAVVADLATTAGDLSTLDSDTTAALALKAPLASPALTGTPTVPTQPPGDNSDKAASTEYVDDAVATGGGGGGGGGTDIVCRVTHSLDQTIGGSTATFLDYDTDIEDASGMHFTSSANLTGTVAKTAASNQLVGSSTLFTSELSVGQVISVPGSGTEKKVVIAIADDTHLTVASNFANTGSGQTAKRVNSAITIRSAGVYVFSMFNRWGNNSFGLREGDVYRNDSAIREIFMNVNAVGGGDPTAFGLTLPPIRCDLWDFFEVKVFQDSGGGINIQALAPYSPVFACFKVKD